MRISRHKTHAVFDRYNIVNEDDLRLAAEKVAQVHKERKAAVTGSGCFPLILD